MKKKEFLEKYVMDDVRDIASIDLDILFLEFFNEHSNKYKESVNRKIAYLRCKINEKKMSGDRLQ